MVVGGVVGGEGVRDGLVGLCDYFRKLLYISFVHDNDYGGLDYVLKLICLIFV